MRILVTQLAETDLDEAYFFTAERWGEAQANVYRARILDTLTLLAANPEIGTPATGSLSGFRMFPVERHGIWYRLADGTLIVTRVIHSRRKVTASLLSTSERS